MKTTTDSVPDYGGLAWAQAPQAPNPTQSAFENGAGSVPVYRITVVARTTKAINYNHRSGSTMIGFQGTALMPAARGEAKVESKQGVIKIDADMERLGPATAFGQEYLTYVMWAVTPEGRATNVGEVLLNGGKSKLDATTELQSFALIITAEPYFAVTQPSDVVVMENFVRKDTTGTIEQVDAKYELLSARSVRSECEAVGHQAAAAQFQGSPGALRGSQCGSDCSLDRSRSLRRRHIPQGDSGPGKCGRLSEG